MPACRLIVVLVLALPLIADEVELKNGSAFSGKIVAEDDTTVSIRIDQGGTLTFEKSQVAKIRRGEMEQSGGPSDGGTKPVELPPGQERKGPKPDLPASGVEQGPLEDLVVRVGPGGVTSQEFEVYLRIYARDHGMEATTPEERRKALEPAIVDEMIFQAALAEGALYDEYVHWSVLSVYKSSETVEKVDPQDFTEEQLHAYFDAHPEEFTEPAAVRLEGKRIDSEEEEAAIVEALQRGETPPGGFSDQGWLEPDTQGPISDEARSALLGLGVGEVSSVIDVFGGLRIVYRCAERREPRKKDFEECRGRVKFLLLGEKASELGEGLGDDDAVYQEALKKGVHRRPECRPYIINMYLDGRKQKKDEAAAELRSRFSVEVLLKD